MRRSGRLAFRAVVVAALVLLGCKRDDRVKPTTIAPVHETPTASAMMAPSADAANADLDPPLVGACATPFPAARLAELARDPAALRPWGKLLVDPDAKVAKELPPTGAPGDPEAVAAAWGFPLPVAYADFLRRFDGADVMGKAGRIEVWGTKTAVDLAADSARPFTATKSHRFVWIGSDGGDWELFVDVDDWFGKGRCAVLFADEASDDVFFLAASFPAAVERVVAGPSGYHDESPLARPRPSK